MSDEAHERFVKEYKRRAMEVFLGRRLKDEETSEDADLQEVRKRKDD